MPQWACGGQTPHQAFPSSESVTPPPPGRGRRNLTAEHHRKEGEAEGGDGNQMSAAQKAQFRFDGSQERGPEQPTTKLRGGAAPEHLGGHVEGRAAGPVQARGVSALRRKAEIGHPQGALHHTSRLLWE